MINKLFSRFMERIKEVHSRFKLATITSAVLALYILVLIMTETLEENNAKAIMVMFMITVTAIFTTLLREFWKLPEVLEYVIPFVLSVPFYFIIDPDNNYSFMAYLGILAALFWFIMALLYRHFDREHLLPWLLSKMIFAGILAGVGFSGTMTALTAFNFLLHEISMEKWLYAVFTIWQWLVFFNVFIYYIPRKDQNISSHKVYDVIAGKVGLIVYLLLVAVLYAYIIKIIVTAEMPVGRLNWFGSFALLGFVFFYLSVRKETGLLQLIFEQYGGMILVPVLLVQLFAIYIRVDSYGLTTLRYMSLLMILIAILFIINTLLKKKLTWIFAAAGIIFLIMTIGPLNALDVPVYNQTSILSSALKKYGMNPGDQLVINLKAEVTDEDCEKMAGAAEYLHDCSSDKVSEWTKKLMNNADFRELVNRVEEIRYDYIYFDYSYNGEISVEGYKTAIKTSAYGIDLDLHDYIYNLCMEYRGKKAPEYLEVVIDDNTKVVLTSLYASVRDDGTSLSYSYEGWVLKK